MKQLAVRVVGYSFARQDDKDGTIVTVNLQGENENPGNANFQMKLQDAADYTVGSLCDVTITPRKKA